MEKEDFKINLKKALDGLIDFTQEMVTNKLPHEYKFIIKTNCSYDGNELTADEEVYPDDKIDETSFINPATESTVIDYLWRNGKVPQWINVQVSSCDSNFSYITLECCGRFSATLNHKDGPFRALGPNIPYRYYDPNSEELLQKVDLNEIKQS
ncbi:hypothetical protein QWY99_17850 [Flavobacterium branchiarum]|uniref:Uncharacterized protein n=1 Tax=Flavobacterium branchiarum TaxID=1114870 RepID=A0ABV5FLQ6_9FLAO|nr:hypothetical protein [Flavobacterium branchiarum]MDN3674906.1 hypothetical protein [Flavobacterium branchiarum]